MLCCRTSWNLEVVPYVGPVISLVPALVIGFAQSPIIGWRLCLYACPVD